MKYLLIKLASFLAPIVTLFYRKGIWVTPDDPVSPYGMYEPAMREKYAKWGKFWADWWWLGIRNRAYGLSYKFKPEEFKGLKTYKDLAFVVEETPRKRVITVVTDKGKYTETTYRLFVVHFICGYRLRPMLDTKMNDVPVREINMDGRPICTVRFGNNDD